MKSSANHQVDGWWSHYIRLIHGSWSDPVGVHKGISICAEPCGMWNSSTDSVFDVSKIFQRRKSDANKQHFEMKLNLTKTIWILTKVFVPLVPYLVILSWMSDKSWCRQAQWNGVNFYFKAKFDLEGQGQSPQKQRDLNQGLLHLWFNLVILAWTGDEFIEFRLWATVFHFQFTVLDIFNCFLVVEYFVPGGLIIFVHYHGFMFIWGCQKNSLFPPYVLLSPNLTSVYHDYGILQ